MIVPLLPKLPTDPAELCRERDRLTAEAGYDATLWTGRSRCPELVRTRHEIIRKLAAWWSVQSPRLSEQGMPPELVRARRDLVAKLMAWWSQQTPREAEHGLSKVLSRALRVHHTTVLLALGRLTRPAPEPRTPKPKSIEARLRAARRTER